MEDENEYSFCNGYLTAGEYVLWKGRPGKGKLLSKSEDIGTHIVSVA